MKKKTRNTTAIDLLFKIVRQETGFTRKQIESPKRTGDVVNAREMTAVILKTKLGYNLAETGYLVNRDHTSVMDMLERYVDIFIYKKWYRESLEKILNEYKKEVLVDYGSDESVTAPYKIVIKEILKDGLTPQNQKKLALMI